MHSQTHLHVKYFTHPKVGGDGRKGSQVVNRKIVSELHTLKCRRRSNWKKCRQNVNALRKF